MTKLTTAVAVLTLAGSAGASTWKSDPAHSKANFAAKHMMVSTVRGELGPITSTLDLDDKDITRSKVDATIDATKINTSFEKRDTHLKSPDFFDVAKFPNVTFKSKKIEKGTEKDHYRVTGDLTIKDKTKEVTLDALITSEVANPFSKAPTRGVSATGTINREDWGLSWNMPMGEGFVVSKDIKIELEVEFVKDEGKNTAAAPAPKK